METAKRDAFSFLTPYPAGPWIHETTRDFWLDAPGDLEIPVLDDGSLVLSNDLTSLDDEARRELATNAVEFQCRRPWWTAPIIDALPTFW